MNGSVGTALTLVGATAKTQVEIMARVSSKVGIHEVIHYFMPQSDVPFSPIVMEQSDRETFVVQIPAFPAGLEVRYYVEVRSTKETGTTVFHSKIRSGVPPCTTCKLSGPTTAIVINEVSPLNETVAEDPHGEFEDYIELKNISSKDVKLSGLYLSDKALTPRKWNAPAGTVISANGYLVLWADKDDKANAGLHTNFKLSKSGETVMLVDSDERHNQVLDEVGCEGIRADIAFGPVPDGTGKFNEVSASTAHQNQEEQSSSQ